MSDFQVGDVVQLKPLTVACITLSGDLGITMTDDDGKTWAFVLPASCFVCAETVPNVCPGCDGHAVICGACGRSHEACQCGEMRPEICDYCFREALEGSR